jgi:hypothetical protein
MDRLKRALKSALSDRSPRFMLGTIALGVVMALVIGFGLGWGAGKVSGGSDGKKAKTAKAGKNAKPKKKKIVLAPDITGGIYQINRAGMTVLNAQSKGVKIALGNNTRVAVSRPATAANVVVGSRVLVVPSAADPKQAAQVIVLPGTALLGTPVSAVSGASVTLKPPLGAASAVNTRGATVWIAAPSTAASLSRGARVMVRYFFVGARRQATATQVVVLPAPPKAA